MFKCLSAFPLSSLNIFKVFVLNFYIKEAKDPIFFRVSFWLFILFIWLDYFFSVFCWNLRIYKLATSPSLSELASLRGRPTLLSKFKGSGSTLIVSWHVFSLDLCMCFYFHYPYTKLLLNVLVSLRVLSFFLRILGNFPVFCL